MYHFKDFLTEEDICMIDHGIDLVKPAFFSCFMYEQKKKEHSHMIPVKLIMV